MGTAMDENLSPVRRSPQGRRSPPAGRRSPEHAQAMMTATLAEVRQEMVEREEALIKWETGLDARLAELEAAGENLQSREEKLLADSMRYNVQGLNWSFSMWKMLAGCTRHNLAVREHITREITGRLGEQVAMRRAPMVGRFLSKMRKRSVWKAWGRWVENAQLERRHRQLLGKATRKIVHRQLARCWRRWVGTSKAAVKATRAVWRMLNHRLSVVFCGWHALVQDQQRRRALLQRCAVRMHRLVRGQPRSLSTSACTPSSQQCTVEVVDAYTTMQNFPRPVDLRVAPS
jgi:sarcosine oxidase delta subunit